MTSVHKNDLLIIQSDWNAIVGKANKYWSNTVGKFALGETNPRGIRLLEFATKNTLKPGSHQNNYGRNSVFLQ